MRDLQLGTDLVSVDRIRKDYERHGVSIFEKLLTPDELAYCRDNIAERKPEIFIKRVAGRIAIKEAVAKAMGVGLNGLGYTKGLNWKEIELVSKSQQPPTLKLHGRAAEVADASGIRTWRLSMSHEGEYAMATVIGLVD